MVTSEELEIVKKIIPITLKDWPKGIKKICGYPIYSEPKTDREYQILLLKQLYPVPPTPPQYYRNYDKLFNTQTWKDFQKWPEYVEKAAKFERMENLLDRSRLELLKLQQQAQKVQAQKHLAAACFKYQIHEEFLIDFNANNPKVKIPNALMIKSKNRDESIRTVQWIITKSNGNFISIKDNGDSNRTRLDQIFTILEDAEENYEKNGRRTLVYVENFDKLLSKSPDNEDVIADLKDIMDKISNQYKTTLIFNCNDTRNLNPIVLQPHRVKIYNLDKEAPLQELEKIQNSYILSNIKKLKDTDGYRFAYVPYDNSYVDLYLGSFGYKPNILWVNSTNTEAIKAVIHNFKLIKSIDKFKNIEILQFPKPDNLKDFSKDKIVCNGNITTDGKVIYEYHV